jgi:hypothetical protein
MGDGSSRLQGIVVSAAAVFAASLAFAPHAHATPGVDEQVAAVQAASAPVVAEVTAAAEPVVAAAQPAVAQPVAAARPVAKTIAAAVKPHTAAVRAVLRSLPAVRHVVPAAAPAATEAVHTPTAVRPRQHSSTRVPSRARPFDRPAGRSLPPDARQLVVRSEPAAPATIAFAPVKAVTAAHAAPQLTLTPLCKAQLSGTVSPGVAGGGAAAAMPSHAAHDPPLAAVRLVTPLQAPRSHAHLLRIERPD